MEIQPLEGSNAILDSVAEEKAIILFLGATDTGKSTLAKYLISILLGLKDENDNTLALGLLDHYSKDENSMKVLTPLRETESVRSIQIGSIRLAPSFEDERL